MISTKREGFKIAKPLARTGYREAAARGSMMDQIDFLNDACRKTVWLLDSNWLQREEPYDSRFLTVHQISAIEQEVDRLMGNYCLSTVKAAVKRVMADREITITATRVSDVDWQNAPSFVESLGLFRPRRGEPSMARGFRGWAKDIQEDAERVWPGIVKLIVANHAEKLFRHLNRTPRQDLYPEQKPSPIEQKLYLALYAHFQRKLICCPAQNCLRLRQHESEISDYLCSHHLDGLFKDGVVNYEIDLFLYLGMSTRLQNGDSKYTPYFVGIECDGHENHKTKEHRASDAEKVLSLKARGLDIVRFTGTQITQNIQGCVEDVLNLIDAHMRECRRLLSDGE